MPTTLSALSFDAHDATRLADFWAALLDGAVEDGASAEYATVQVPGTPGLAFTQVPETKTAKNRLHLDLGVVDLDAEVDRAAALGASEVARHSDGTAWVVMQDVEGNEFCLAQE